MSYIDQIAARIHAEVPGDLVPPGDVRLLFRMYAVLALTKGHATGPADVHDAWSVWMLERDPDHGSIQPFAELPPSTQRADTPFVEAIHRVARDLPGRAGRTGA